MSFDVFWPGPVRRRIAGYNIPAALELAIVNQVDARLMDCEDHHGGVLHLEGSWASDSGELFFEYCCSLEYTWDDGKCVVSNIRIDLIDRAV